MIWISRLYRSGGSVKQNLFQKCLGAFAHFSQTDTDIILYGSSAIFAAMTVLTAVSSDYRIWGLIAGFSYLAGCVASVVLKIFSKKISHNQSQITTGELIPQPSKQYGASDHLSVGRINLFRYLLMALVFLSSLVIPLTAELIFRANANPGANAQSEVAVIERAGDRLMSGHDLYLRNPTSVGVSPHSDNKSIDASSYFPYFPTMALFGILNSSSLPPEFGDARFLFSLFTLLVSIYAIGQFDIPFSGKARIFQIFLVLPLGTLPLVTGGDDLPVLAMMLLGLILAARGKPLSSGLVMGIASTLKFTSWPLVFLACFVLRDKNDKTSYKKFLAMVLVVLVPVLFIGILPNSQAFVTNVIRFPLGISKISSPAASPLLGQVLVSIFPSEKKNITYLLLLIGVLLVVAAFYKYRPKSVADAAKFAAFVMFLATILAPATRFGYLIYPVNLFVWGYFLSPNTRKNPSLESEDTQLASLIS